MELGGAEKSEMGGGDKRTTQIHTIQEAKTIKGGEPAQHLENKMLQLQGEETWKQHGEQGEGWCLRPRPSFHLTQNRWTQFAQSHRVPMPYAHTPTDPSLHLVSFYSPFR